MLVTNAQCDHLQTLLTEPNVGFWAYIAQNPYLLMPMGFDEVRIQPSALACRFKRLRERTRRMFDADSRVPPSAVIAARREVFEQQQHEEEEFCDLVLGLNCRELRSGAWFKADAETRIEHWLHLLESDCTTEEELLKRLGTRVMSLRALSLLSGSSILSITPQGILNACRTVLQAPGFTAALVLPRLWTPPDKHNTIEVVEVAKRLLVALQEQKTSLDALRWQDMEGIVAELLRDRGMEVTITPRSRDGGRDVIATGELIPGEPAVLAVEVKHKALVSLDEVRSRLYANSQFPALLFATSGRFTAGVVREKRRPENYLRLFLKDRTALAQWINAYGKFGPKSRQRNGCT